MSPEQELAEYKAKYPSGGKLSRERYRRWTWGVVTTNTVALILLYILAHGIADYSQWASVIAVAIVGLVSLDVVTLSALTSREVVEIMSFQEFEMTKQRETTGHQLTAMKDALTEMGQQREIMGGQLDAARITLIQTKNFFELAERPRMGMERVTLDKIVAYKDLKVNITWRNSGKSTAQIIHGLGQLVSYEKRYVSDECCPRLQIDMRLLEGMISRPAIAANSTFTQFCGLGTIPDREYVKQIESGDLVVFVWSQVLYLGFGPDPYVSQYYARYYPHLKAFGECSDGNLFT